MPAVVAMAFLGLVGAAGCQSNPEPPPISGDESSSSPTPSPTPTQAAPPSIPAEAQGTSEASAKAFVRHYVAVLNYAGPAGDDKAVRKLSSPECTACIAIADFIKEVEQSGGSIEGKGWQVRDVAVVSSLSDEQIVLDVTTRVNTQTVTTAAEAEPQTFSGGRRLKTFWLAHGSEGWTVTRLDQPQ